MKFKSYIKYPTWNTDQDGGFTLIELLVAAVIMSIVMTLAGSAFVTILEQNRKAESESQTRQNLNRALDYIANDIRQATTVQAGTATGEVFKLSVPNVDPVAANLDTGFYTSTTHTYSVATSSGVWRDYNDPTPRSVMRNGNFLVNNIIAPSSAPTCPTGSTRSSTDNNGLYACIYTGGNKVDLYLYGRLSPSGTMLVKSTVYTRSKTGLTP